MNYSEPSQRRSSAQLLIAGFIVLIALSALFALVALHENNKIVELNDKMYRHPFSVSNAVLKANTDIIAMHRYMKDVVLSANKDDLEAAILLVDQHEQEVYRHFKLIKERFLGDEETVNLSYKAFMDWKAIRNEVIALQRNNQNKEAAAITVGKGAMHVKLLTQRMDVLTNFARNKALEFKDNSQKAYEKSKSYLYALFVLLLLSGVGTAFFVVTRVRKAELALRSSEERFQGLFNNSDISIWSEDFSLVLVVLENLRLEGVTNLKQHLESNISLAWKLSELVKVNHVNNTTLKLFGARNKDEFVYKISETFGSNAIEVFIDELCAIWSKQKGFQSEANFKTLDGKEISALLSFQIPTTESDFRNIPVSIVDITERKKAEEQLRLSSRVFSDTNEGIIITDANKLIIDVNPAFSKITGYSREEVIGESPSILKSEKQSPEFYAVMWQHVNEHGHWQGELWNCKKNGEFYAELLTISSLKDSNDNIDSYVGLFTDITHSKLQQENMELMAHYDTLTKLPNRALLTDRFNQAIAHTKRSGVLLAVCFLDIDDFKPVNDDFGHGIGDKLLIEIAHRLKSAVRDEDTVSRLGGDEFVLLLVDIESIEKCSDLLERIMQSIQHTYALDGQSINISASLGISLYPLDDMELDVLVRHADQAMYKAKQEGKNKYRFFGVNEAQ